MSRDGIELSYGRSVFGRVHEDGRVELRFHPRVRDMLVETGRAEPRGGRGWVGVRDAADALELFRLAYERARVTQAVREARRA